MIKKEKVSDKNWERAIKFLNNVQKNLKDLHAKGERLKTKQQVDELLDKSQKEITNK